MVKRYELPEAQWRRIEDLLPGTRELDDLVEKLIGILFFAQGELQELDNRPHVQLLRKVSRRDAAGHLVC
jgi:hypothetical protein